MTVTASLDGDRIALDAPLSDSPRVKTIPGRRHDVKARRWTVPLSWAACVQLRATFGDELIVADDLAHWAQAHLQVDEDPRALDHVLDPRLFPFQRKGVEFLLRCGSGLLGDEMGTGKTVQVVQALTKDHLPCLIVAPSSVKESWARHVANWRPDLVVNVLRGTPKVRAAIIDSEYDVLVVGWEQLRLHSRLSAWGNTTLTAAEARPKELNAVDWGCVVADEAHRAKEPTSKVTRALWAVSADARHRYALTGTPIANAPDDLWTVMRFVSPEEYPVRGAYVERYCVTAASFFSPTPIVVGMRASAREEFDRFFQPRFLRRLKAQVLPDLPPVLREVRLIDMDARQEKAYRELEREMRTHLDSATLEVEDKDGSSLVLLTRLLQLASSYLEYDEYGAWTCANPSSKVQALLDLADERAGRPTVVFAASSRLLELCSRELHKAKVNHALITGAVSEAQRQAYVDAFQRGELPVLLVTLGAGGEGITLTAADTVVFLQRSWSMVQNLQAEARIHRPGQEAQSCLVIDVRTRGTVESRVLQLYGDKLDRLEELVRDQNVLRGLIT